MKKILPMSEPPIRLLINKLQFHFMIPVPQLSVLPALPRGLHQPRAGLRAVKWELKYFQSWIGLCHKSNLKDLKEAWTLLLFK